MLDALLGPAAPHAYILRRDAIEMGVDDDALRRLVKAGIIRRVRQGVYVPCDVWRRLEARDRHALVCRAVLDQYGDHVVLSHASQAIMDGAPDWGLDLSAVHLTHLTGGGRRTAGIVHHGGKFRVSDLRREGGTWSTTPTRTVLDTCGTVSTEAGLVLANWFLNAGLTTPELLAQRYVEMQRWPQMIAVRLVLHLTDGRIGSVGESRFFYLVWRAGLPLPVPQWAVWDGGRLVGIVDFAWPELGVMAEFDGRIKYGRLLKPGQSTEDVLFAEKRREDELREITGFRMVRSVWSDLDRPEVLVSRLRRALFRAA